MKIIVYQVLKALKYMQSNLYIHLDIKGGNILIDYKGDAKICDFGLSRKLDNSPRKNYSNDMVGTPYWMAPEIITNKYENVGFWTDIWSLGCTIIECLTGSPPFGNL